MTVVRPPSRFGFVSLNGDIVEEFEEKPQMQSGFINGGFFVFNKKILDYLYENDDCDLEFGTLDVLANQKNYMLLGMMDSGSAWIIYVKKNI